jgi:hypothetical protein
MVKDDSAFDVKVPIVGDGGMRLAEQLLELRLAVLDRLLRHVLTIDLDQIEGIERRGATVTVVTDQIENGETGPQRSGGVRNARAPGPRHMSPQISISHCPEREGKARPLIKTQARTTDGIDLVRDVGHFGVSSVAPGGRCGRDIQSRLRGSVIVSPIRRKFGRA